jgi:hypothetical protein
MKLKNALECYRTLGALYEAIRCFSTESFFLETACHVELMASPGNGNAKDMVTG